MTEPVRKAALIYRIIFFVLLSFMAGSAIWHAFHPRPGVRAQGTLRPEQVLIGELFAVVIVALLTVAGAYLERVELRDFGVPLREAFRGKFWTGALWGFLGLSALIGIMKLLHSADYGSVLDPATLELKNGTLFALGFIGTGIFEELVFRGYLLWFLTRVLGFWPAALVSSLLFGAVHTGNPGEAWYGLLTVVLVGFVFCLMVQRTGNLWFPIGFHAAWDWAQTYFYGSPDSGLLASGSLFRTQFHGPVWITGGTVGPEGSFFCFVVIIAVGVLFGVVYRGRKYWPERVVPTQPTATPVVQASAT